MKKWFAGIVVSRRTNGVLKFLLLDSRTINPKYDWQGIQTKFPGGMNNDHPEEGEPIETALRELTEETGLLVKAGIVPKKIHQEEISKDNVKVFFHIRFKDCEGMLRTEEKQDGDDIISPPYFADFQDAEMLVYPTHKSALYNANHLNLVGR